MSNAPTFPEQAWAHKLELVNMLPHGAAQVTDNVLDRLLIHEAFARFGMAHDEARTDVLASLFTSDAVLEVAKGKAPFQRVVGRDTMVKNFGAVISQQTDQRRHCMTNVLIEKLTAKEASALAYGVVTVAADGIIVGASVIYSGDLRREDDGMWRFTRLLIGMDDYSGKPPDVSKFNMANKA
jgi:hypothetical protein